MSLITISAAAVFDHANFNGGAGLHIWSGDFAAPHHDSMAFETPSEIAGSLAMVATGLVIVADRAVAGDVVHICIRGGQAALDGALDCHPAATSATELVLNLVAALSSSLDDAGVAIKWLVPVRSHSGIAHARVAACEAGLQALAAACDAEPADHTADLPIAA
ncbi:hypothetical protein ACOI1H_14645 [Loktanella sp. DJP18]|uniref:hypothetical protein n=1 Tax=Loktanella sp. DJP18 TaxID=3409788 RepID=UPI003BB58B18